MDKKTDLSQKDIRVDYFHAEWRSYKSIDELAAATERYIVKVKVLDERAKRINSSLTPSMPSYNINTVNRLHVLEVFKGNARPGEIIEVRQEGGLLDNVHLINEDFVPLMVGDELVVFLYGVDPEEYKEFPVAKFAVLVSPWQAFYRADTLKSLHPDNDLVLTRADLARIKQKYLAQ